VTSPASRSLLPFSNNSNFAITVSTINAILYVSSHNDKERTEILRTKKKYLWVFRTCAWRENCTAVTAKLEMCKKPRVDRILNGCAEVSVQPAAAVIMIMIKPNNGVSLRLLYISTRLKELAVY